MALAAANAAAAASSIVVLLLVVVLVPPPAEAAGGCNAMKDDVVVNQDVGRRKSNGAKKFTVEVSNEAGVPVSGIHLWCGYDFRTVSPVDPAVIALVKHGDCLLIGGAAIAPGGSVSFTYTSYVRYDMHVLLAATCDATAAGGP